ncbi:MULTISPECIES: hypothetical protein [Glaesserella]|uniref:Uncharacterized protein n=1 Tax=Glaesserella australis TaxID=2094024 RepID=A0A328BZC9_9PAST|nr:MULTISPECIES: hypothetical protein [Glaesserella]AUI65180.1 hypothetical protein CJD39_00695 [Glaesserella sp. 15-184]RAL18452.1 hypothetical protein C5N92_06985 [Glaesserella australis]
MAVKQIYAAYAGERYIMDGTAIEVALGMKISVETVRKLATPSYAERTGKGLSIVKLGREEVGDRK